MFNSIFSFQGRIRRLEYALSWVIYYIYSSMAYFILLSFGLIDQMIIHMKFMDIKIPNNVLDSPIVMMVYLPVLWFMITQRAKRCHDRGNSGWFQIIPFYGLWMLLADGDTGPNDYGDNPKGWDYDDTDEPKNNFLE
ncbi:DUF805 domain-containing protein [Pedobacter ginsengisoli]|uniref:DUF805 domain-containing protein n=1 Tax=Pedobacter ginsengisoli TaxID=363852 RepID=UPI0025517B34|nr:DUF805 domain-containing protein [Pedobacter ginsengisoli]